MSLVAGTVVFALTPELQTFLAVGVGLAALATAVAVVRRVFRRRSTDDVPSRQVVLNDAPSWKPEMQPRRPVNERRRFGRRDGRTVKVVLARPDLSEEMGEAVVVGRSPGGVRPSVRVALALGTHLNIRPSDLAEPHPWLL